MATRRWILILPSALMMAALAGCGSNTFNVQNPPPPPPSSLCVTFSGGQCPPASQTTYSVLVDGKLSLSATVTNDPSNAGVDWSLTCSNVGNCGTLTPSHTDSVTGTVDCAANPTTCTTYTPPTSLVGNSQMVNIVAYATADHTKNALATATITAFGNNLQGNYVLQAQGVDINGGPNYQFAGVITLDGNGGIISGEQTINFFDTNLGALVSATDPIIGGSYFLGGDGRGTITINTNNQDIGFGSSHPGAETFTFVYLDSSHALIAQGDLPDANGNSCALACTGATASGTMELQTSTAPLSGGYAFVVGGQDVASGNPTAFGGVFSLDASGLLFCTTPSTRKYCEIDKILSSGAGAIPAGTTSLDKTLSGTLSYPSPNPLGVVTLSLTAGFTAGSPSNLTLTGYIVDSAHIKLIESDNTPTNPNPPFGSTAGVAIGQTNAPGTFSNASFSGPYAFGVLGTDLTSSTPTTMTSVGVMTPDGSGNLTSGFTDTFLQANLSQQTLNGTNPNLGNPNPGAQISTTFSGTYSVDPNGVGRLAKPAFLTLALPKSFGRPPAVTFIFYLTGNGTTALVLDYADIISQSPSVYPLLGAGIAYPQATASLTFNGEYGFSFTEFNGGENDATAPVSVDSTAQTLSGSADVSVPNFVTLNAPFFGVPPTPTDCLTGTPVNGCFAELLEDGTAANPGGSSPFLSANQPFPADFYMIDQDHGFFVETDLTSLGNPYNPSGVVSFGYYTRGSLPTPPGNRAVKRHRR